MDKLQPRKWRQLLIFVFVSCSTLGFMMAMAETYTPNVTHDMFSSKLGTFASRFIDLSSFTSHQLFPPYDASTRTVTLARGESVELDRIRITYRGLINDDKMKIDVIIPNLDREAVYRHTIDIGQARQGFRLYLDQFELIGAKANRLQLRYVSNPSM